jgi:hypothetical protein
MTHRPCAVPGCDKSTPDQYPVCRACLSDLVNDLTDLWRGPEINRWEYEPGLIDDLIDVMARLMRSGIATGVTSRSATTPLPYHESASQLLWTVRNTLSVWCQTIYQANPRYAAPHGGSPELAHWLATSLLGIARHPEVAKLRDEIAWLTEQVRDAVDIAPLRVYLGECGAQCGGRECTDPIYALPSHTTVSCRACGAVYDVVDRRTELLSSAEDHLAPAGEICRALSTLGAPLSLRRIRVWAHRGRLVKHEPHPLDPRHRPRYRLGDVVGLLLRSDQKVDVRTAVGVKR